MDQGADQMQNMDQQIHQDVHLDEQPTPNIHQESDQEQYVDRGVDQIQNMNKQIQPKTFIRRVIKGQEKGIFLN